MFCMKCGAKILEGASFCVRCGAPLQNQEQLREQNQSVTDGAQAVQSHAQPAQRQNPLEYQGEVVTSGYVAQPENRKKKAGIVAIAAAGVAVVAIAILTVVILFGGRSYEATIDQYLHAMFSADIKNYTDVIPEGALKALMVQNGYNMNERDLFLAEGQEILESGLGGENHPTWVIEHEIEGVRPVLGKDLSEIQRTWWSIGVDVSEAIIADVKNIWTDDGETSEITGEISLVKVGNSWYIDITKERSPWGFPN